MVLLFLAMLSQIHDDEVVEVSHSQLVRWVLENHQGADYPSPDQRAGGRLLSLDLLSSMDQWFHPEPPTDPTLPEATWTWDGSVFTRLEDGATFTGSSIEDWLGADFWSSSSRNNQPMPGKKPGDVLLVGPGSFKYGRWTLHYDLNLEAIKRNPTRLGDPVGYPNRPFTYVNDDGTLRYGLNNRDGFKGAWTKATAQSTLEPSYPAWFTWGYDPQTWVIGSVDENGFPTTIVDQCYHEHVGACSERNLLYLSLGTGAGIWQTENPIPYDAAGNRLMFNWPEDPDATTREWATWRDIDLGNVHVDGQWDPWTDTHPPGVSRSKWGMFGYRVGRSSQGPDVPGFAHVGGSIRGIHTEHANYWHNTRAVSPDHFAFLASDIEISGCRRTAYQFVSRSYDQDGNLSVESEGPPGQGRIELVRIKVRRVCLEGNGGGSAFTFAGNHDGDVLLQEVDCWLGDPKLETPNITGGFVSHAGGGSGGQPTRSITLQDCWFRCGGVLPDGRIQSGEGSARRPNLQIGAVGTFKLRNTAVWQVDGARPALHFREGIGHVELDPGCDIRGDILASGGQTWKDEDQDGDGWDDGKAWPQFLKEIVTGEDTNGDGVIVTNSGAWASVEVTQ